MKATDININKLTDRMTLNVKIAGVRELKSRVTIGSFFIKLGAKIMGVGVKIETDA